MDEAEHGRLRVLCETAELAVSCLRAADAVGLAVATEVPQHWGTDAVQAAGGGGIIGLARQSAPDFEALLQLAEAAVAAGGRLVLGLMGPREAHADLLAVAGDLGITAVSELGPLVAALRLSAAGVEPPYALGTRGLSALDRVRMGPVLGGLGSAGGALRSGDAGLVELLAADTDHAPGAPDAVRLGTAPEVAAALTALQRTEQAPEQVTSNVDGVDAAAVADVLFGPRRALSDPASKAVLAPYGIPLPEEELCSSASRAAAEAARIGFPVRIALASPDLRTWDHPDLVVDMVDGAARVREIYRTLMGLGASRAAHEGRLLGVTVTAANESAALLGIVTTPLSRERVLTRIGFADPHGWASQDFTSLVLPAPLRRIERALGRLSGVALLRGSTPTQRRERATAVAELLLRVAALCNAHRSAIERIELRPVAMRLDGTLEVREACVSVSDTFERSLTGP